MAIEARPLSYQSTTLGKCYFLTPSMRKKPSLPNLTLLGVATLFSPPVHDSEVDRVIE